MPKRIKKIKHLNESAIHSMENLLGSLKHTPKKMIIQNESFLGWVHEYGVTINVTEKQRRYLHAIGLHLKATTQTITIPERAPVRITLLNNASSIGSAIFETIDKQRVKKTWKKIEWQKHFGKIIIDMIERTIEGGLFPENHPFTLSRKEGNTPLMDKGKLIRGYKVLLDF